MLTPEHRELIRAAQAVQGTVELSEPAFCAGSTGAALRTVSGAIYTGVCMDVACGIGFCAEHAAIAEMLKHREVEIATDAWSSYVSLGLGTLDDPASVEPRIHMWTDSRLPWFDTRDDLPKVSGGTLPHPSTR